MNVSRHLPGTDILLDMSDNYDRRDGKKVFSHTSLGIGDALSHNFFINNFGKANFCVKPQAALNIGGHHEGEYSRSPFVDWAFLTRASLAGLNIELVPRALYEYSKRSKGSIWYGMTNGAQQYDGHAKMVEDVIRSVPKQLQDAIKLCRYRLALPEVKGDGPV